LTSGSTATDSTPRDARFDVVTERGAARGGAAGVS
jgi:hypothetical protein